MQEVDKKPCACLFIYVSLCEQWWWHLFSLLLLDAFYVYYFPAETAVEFSLLDERLNCCSEKFDMDTQHCMWSDWLIICLARTELMSDGWCASSLQLAFKHFFLWWERIGIPTYILCMICLSWLWPMYLSVESLILWCWWACGSSERQSETKPRKDWQLLFSCHHIDLTNSSQVKVRVSLASLRLGSARFWNQLNTNIVKFWQCNKVSIHLSRSWLESWLKIYWIYCPLLLYISGCDSWHGQKSIAISYCSWSSYTFLTVSVLHSPFSRLTLPVVHGRRVTATLTVQCILKAFSSRDYTICLNTEYSSNGGNELTNQSPYFDSTVCR